MKCNFENCGRCLAVTKMTLNGRPRLAYVAKVEHFKPEKLEVVTYGCGAEDSLQAEMCHADLCLALLTGAITSKYGNKPVDPNSVPLGIKPDHVYQHEAIPTEGD